MDVTGLLDRAARITGLRTTGTERQLALDALNDIYGKSIMLVQHEQRTYRHTFSGSVRETTIEKHNRLDFASLGRNRIFSIGAGGPQSLENEPIVAATVQIRSTDLLTTYANGVDYTVDGPAGDITNISVPIGNVVVQYLVQNTSNLPVIRDADIQIPPNYRIISAVYQDIGNSSYPLVHVGEAEILEYRRGYSVGGFSRIYSVAGDGFIRFWPEPSNGDSVQFTYVPKPPILSEDVDRPPALWDTGVWGISEWDDARGFESTPSMVPDQFHQSVLLPGTVVQLLDKDQRMEQAQWWQGRYEAGIEEMMVWISMYGGDPTPMFDRNRPEFVNYPDQWNRR